MKFDVKTYKAENDQLKLTQAQKNAIVARVSAENAARKGVVRFKWIKAAAAVMAVAVLGSGMLFGGKILGGSGNMFTITAKAASSDETRELTNDFEPIGTIRTNGGGQFYEYNDDDSLIRNYIFRLMDFSLDCFGENIEEITYTAHNCAFKIIDKKGIRGIVRSEELDGVMADNDAWRNSYSSYTVDPGYINKNVGEEPNICLATGIDMLSENVSDELKVYAAHGENFRTEAEARSYYQLEADVALRDISVDVTVKFKNGETATKTLVFEAKVRIENWELDSDGEYSCDNKTVISAKII